MIMKPDIKSAALYSQPKIMVYAFEADCRFTLAASASDNGEFETPDYIEGVTF